MVVDPPSSMEAMLAAAWPPEAWHDVGVVVAVSGGADSVALLHLMAALKAAGEGRLSAAHFNHRLRADEADADQAFVVELCRRLQVPCEVGHASGGQIPAGGGDGLESAARTARYDFLRQTAARLGARYVVTAHTADDQAETILHRIIRGTGIAGLAGMARARRLGPATTVIRPLLGVRRVELLAYLNHLGQPYRTDSTNDDVRFTRNRIRHTLLPKLLREYNPGVVEALLRLGSLAGEVQSVVDAICDDLAERCVQPGDEARTLWIDTTVLSGQPRYMIRELLIAVWRKQSWPLQAMGFAQWDLLAEMLCSSGGQVEGIPQKQMFPGSVLAEISGDRLKLGIV